MKERRKDGRHNTAAGLNVGSSYDQVAVRAGGEQYTEIL